MGYRSGIVLSCAVHADRITIRIATLQDDLKSLKLDSSKLPKQLFRTPLVQIAASGMVLEATKSKSGDVTTHVFLDTSAADSYILALTRKSKRQ